MGGVCSLEDPYDDSDNHSKIEEVGEGRRVAPINQPAKPANNATANQPVKQSAREIALTKLWNSVVVGELVKHHALSMADETMPIHQCVQQMIKQGSNYCIVKKVVERSENGIKSSSNQSTSQFHHSADLTSPSAIANRKRNKETYVGLFDWRDLTALLVMVCKQARLHGNQANSTFGTQCALSPKPVSKPSSKVMAVDDSPTKKIGEKIPLISAQSTRMISQSTKEETNKVDAQKAEKEEKEEQTTEQPADQSTEANPTHTAQVSIDASATESPSPAGSKAHPSPVNPIKPAIVTSVTQSTTLTPPSETPIQPINPLDEYLHFLDMKRCPTGLVANLSGRNPMQIVNQVCPLLGGVRVLVAANDPLNGVVNKKKNVWSNRHSDSAELNAAALKQELYRLTVVDKNGLYVGCLTQLAICHWIESKLAMLCSDPTSKDTSQTPLSEHCLHDLGLGQRRVMTIGWKAPVLSAITLMHEKSLSALAIINDTNGKLVGTISCSDVKYLFGAPDLLLTLERPVSVFISMLRQSTSYWHVNLASNPPPTATSSSVTVTPRTTLSSTISTLLATKVRRAWVINDAEQPIGYISITDIIKFFLQQTGQKK